MKQVEIIIDAEGKEDQLDEFRKKYQLKLDYDREANFDGTLCCSVIGTVVNIGMFLLQVYTLWGNKRVKLRAENLEVDEITIKNVIDFLNSQKDKEHGPEQS